MEPALLLEQSGLDKAVFDAMTARLIQQGKVALRKDRLALSGFVEQFKSPEAKLMGQVESLFQQNLFSPPSWRNWGIFSRSRPVRSKNNQAAVRPEAAVSRRAGDVFSCRRHRAGQTANCQPRQDRRPGVWKVWTSSI